MAVADLEVASAELKQKYESLNSRTFRYTIFIAMYIGAVEEYSFLGPRSQDWCGSVTNRNLESTLLYKTTLRVP